MDSSAYPFDLIHLKTAILKPFNPNFPVSKMHIIKLLTCCPGKLMKRSIKHLPSFMLYCNGKMIWIMLHEYGRLNSVWTSSVAAITAGEQLLKHLWSQSLIALKMSFLLFSFHVAICCGRSSLFWHMSSRWFLLPNELLDAVEFVEPEVGDVMFDFVAAQVCGVDLLYSSAADQRNTLVTWAFGHKNHCVLLLFYLCAPECERVLLRMEHVSVLPVLSLLLLVIHLRILSVLWAHWIGVVPTAH